MLYDHQAGGDFNAPRPPRFAVRIGADQGEARLWPVTLPGFEAWLAHLIATGYTVAEPHLRAADEVRAFHVTTPEGQRLRIAVATRPDRGRA